MGSLNPIRVRPCPAAAPDHFRRTALGACRLAGEALIPGLIVEKHDRLAIAEEALSKT